MEASDDCLSENFQNSWNQKSKVNVLYTTSGSPRTEKSPDFRKKDPQSSPKGDSSPEKVGYKGNQRFSTIAVGRSDKDNVRGTVKSVFENGDRKVEDLSTVEMRGHDGCFGPVSRARSVLILSNIDNVDNSLNRTPPMTRYKPKIRVSCFEDEYYEKETLKDDEYLHTITFGYSDVDRKKASKNVYSTPPNNLVVVHPSSLTPNANDNRKYRRNVDSNRRKTTEIFATVPTPPAANVKPQQPTLANPTVNERRITTMKMSSSMTNLRVGGESERKFIRKNAESKTEAKNVKCKENGEKENDEDIDVGRMLQQQRLEKEYEILNNLVQQWQDYSKRNEQKIKKGGTLTLRHLTQSQQLQMAMMEQQKTIERLLLGPKSEPSPTFPTTPEPPKPSIDTDSLVYKAGPTPYRSVFNSTGNIEKMVNSRKSIVDVSPNRPIFELSSSRKSSINPTASITGDQNSIEIQIPVRRTSRSFYNEFSRGESPTLNEQRRRDSSCSGYNKSTVGAATTTLPPDDVWDYEANGRLSRNEILKPSQLFAYSAKKHENEGDRCSDNPKNVPLTGRSHSPTPMAAQRAGRRPASEDSVTPQLLSTQASCPTQSRRPLSSQSPSGADPGRYSSVYQSSSQYFSSLAGRHPTPAATAASSTDAADSKKLYFKNYYAAPKPCPTVKKSEETWREGHTRLMRELRDLNKF